jgi:hypothetical protein
MSRIINTDSTGKHRSQQMRLSAELLRRLSQKTEMDAEAKDMAATLVYCFRKIDEGIEQSASVWDNRDYYMKAEELRQRWAWAGRSADALNGLIQADQWVELPGFLLKIFPHFSDITVAKFTSKEEDWNGNYMKLIDERAR